MQDVNGWISIPGEGLDGWAVSQTVLYSSMGLVSKQKVLPRLYRNGWEQFDHSVRISQFGQRDPRNLDLDHGGTQIFHQGMQWRWMHITKIKTCWDPSNQISFSLMSLLFSWEEQEKKQRKEYKKQAMQLTNSILNQKGWFIQIDKF